MSIFAGEDISVSYHATRQWDRRTAIDSVAPETAWREAWPVTVDAPSYRHLGEIRYHDPTTTVLLCGMGQLVTCIDVSTPAPRGPHDAYELRAAIARQYPHADVVVPEKRAYNPHRGALHIRGVTVDVESATGETPDLRFADTGGYR
jgi:hypothetical protein